MRGSAFLPTTLCCVSSPGQQTGRGCLSSTYSNMSFGVKLRGGCLAVTSREGLRPLFPHDPEANEYNASFLSEERERSV